jgi:hypothetical protein
MNNSDYIESAIKQFQYYKVLGEKALEQIPDDKLNWQYNPETNSVAIILKHLWGNMMSRWVEFLTKDGEKVWRNRESEFDNDITSRKELMEKWVQCHGYSLEKSGLSQQNYLHPKPGPHHHGGYQPTDLALRVSRGANCAHWQNDTG